jgi:hypothetical protein
VENLSIYGVDVSNAFAEPPPPKQGFYIQPDKVFFEWWALKMDGHKPIAAGYVIFGSFCYARTSGITLSVGMPH